MGYGVFLKEPQNYPDHVLASRWRVELGSGVSSSLYVCLSAFEYVWLDGNCDGESMYCVWVRILCVCVGLSWDGMTGAFLYSADSIIRAEGWVCEA